MFWNSLLLCSWPADNSLLFLLETIYFLNSCDISEILIASCHLVFSLQIFPDPSDFDRCCKLKDRLPSIVVEPTEGEVESGELRWPPEEFLVSEEEEEDEEQNNGSIQNGQPLQNSQH